MSNKKSTEKSSEQPTPARYKVTERKVTDYQPDPQNANRGNRRGQKMLEQSYKKYGAGRSWLADKDGQLVAGNHARQAAIESGIEDVIEIEVADPKMQVVVRRPDVDLDGEDPAARELAFADNRTGEISLEWSPEEIAAHEALLRDAELFRDDEIEALLALGEIEEFVGEATGDGSQHPERTSLEGRQAKISPVMYMEDLRDFEDAIRLARDITGERRRGACLAYVCKFFLDQMVDDELKGLLDGDAEG